MKTMMLHHHHLLQHIQALHRQTTPPTLLRLGTRKKLYVFKPFWSLLTKGGEAYDVYSLQAGQYGRVPYVLLYFALCLQLLLFASFGSLSCKH